MTIFAAIQLLILSGHILLLLCRTRAEIRSFIQLFQLVFVIIQKNNDKKVSQNN